MENTSALNTEREDRRRRLREEHSAELAAMVEKAKDESLYECSIREDFPAAELSVFMARRRGRSHEAKGTSCQDYCLTAGGSRCVILTAADGVGSCPKSDEGARLACETAAATVRAAAQHCGSEQELTDILCGVKFRERLVKRWLAAVIGLMDSDGPVPAEERNERMREYSSTLMWVVATDRWYVAGNVGDGQILFFNEAEAVKLREHPRKVNSRVRALIHDKCYLEDFQVGRFRRADFDGVLLTTDGMYDILSPGLHLHRYALQLKDRFLESGRPLQPFCYREPGEEMKDISMAMTMDDCTVVLALDSRPACREAFTDRSMADVLSDQAMLQRRSGDVSLYLLRSGEDFLQMTASPASGQGITLPELENAAVARPVRILDRGLRRYALYEDTDAPTLELVYGSGMLRETKDGNRLILPLYRRLLGLQRELERHGLTLTDAAAFLICVSTGGRQSHDSPDDFSLILKSEAAARKDETARPPVFWQYFAALEGTLTCRGFLFPETERPVFSCGYMLMGNIISGMAPGEESRPLMRLKQDGKGGLTALNVSESPWSLPGGETVMPGEGTPLSDGLRFCTEEPEKEDAAQPDPGASESAPAEDGSDAGCGKKAGKHSLTVREYVYRSREAL